MSIVIKLQSKLPTIAQRSTSEIPTNPNSIFFKPATPNEVNRIIQGLKNNSNLSEIPSKFVKLLAPQLCKTLSELFNECIANSVYPICLKKLIVEPRYKSGDKTLISNHRQISLNNLVSKIFEKLIFNRLYSFFDVNKLISNNQFGFLKNRSTAQANGKLIHHSLPAIKDNTYTISVYLDMSKAFDCVDHAILLEKFEKYGIRGNTLKFLKSYLSDRTQRVKIGENTFSKSKKVKIGVPQGSCLGPLFYLIYCNDINNIVTDVKIVNYADDCVLIINGTVIGELTRIMNEALRQVSIWCIMNKLTINPDKSKCLIFSKRKIPQSITLFLNDQAIQLVSTVNYLGIFLNHRLSLSRHVENLNLSLSQLEGISFKLTYKFNVNTAKSYFY